MLSSELKELVFGNNDVELNGEVKDFALWFNTIQFDQSGNVIGIERKKIVYLDCVLDDVIMDALEVSLMDDTLDYQVDLYEFDSESDSGINDSSGLIVNDNIITFEKGKCIWINGNWVDGYDYDKEE